MESIHAKPPKVGQMFVAVASDKSGAGVYRCIGDGVFLELGQTEPLTDESLMLNGSEWCPVDDRDLAECFESDEGQSDG